MATARRVCHGLPVSDPPPGPPSAARVAVATVSAAAIALAAAPTLGRPWVGLLPPALLLLAYRSHTRAQVQARNAAIVAAATALTLLLPPGWWGWPAPLAILAIAGARPELRGERGPVSWLRAGAVGRGGIAWAGAIALVSGGALAAWFVLARPDLGDLTPLLRRVPAPALLAGGLVWAGLNAFGEESIYRGALMAGLESSFGPRAALLLQAVAFGAAHWRGVPRGAVGVLLATVYGLLLGLLRRRTGGLLAPVIAHVLADVVVLALLVAAA